jgi:hypothetical protein
MAYSEKNSSEMLSIMTNAIKEERLSQILTVLIESRGFKINGLFENSDDPLVVIAVKTSLVAFHYLICQRQDVETNWIDEDGNNLLMMLFALIEDEDVHYTQKVEDCFNILTKTIDINAKNNNGESVLMMCENKPHCKEFLIRRGALNNNSTKKFNPINIVYHIHNVIVGLFVRLFDESFIISFFFSKKKE